MRLTEETDAIRTLGLSPEQVLVVPRVLALVVSLPLLVFAGDLAGLLGAVVVSNLMLDITPTTFVDRLHTALAAKHYVIGLGKAPVFALFIAVIGCRMGVTVEPRHPIDRHPHDVDGGAEHRGGDPARRAVRRAVPGARPVSALRRCRAVPAHAARQPQASRPRW